MNLRTRLMLNDSYLFKDKSLFILFKKVFVVIWGFPGGSDCKESACKAGDLGSIPGLGRSPGGWHGNPLQYSCLENPHGQRSLAGYSPWGLKESDMTEQLSTAGKKYHIIFWYKLKKHKDKNMGARGIFHSSKLIFYIKTEILLKKNKWLRLSFSTLNNIEDHSAGKNYYVSANVLLVEMSRNSHQTV